MADHVLEVVGLSVEFHTAYGRVQAVKDVSFHLDRGETLAILGESGSGKSVSASAVMNLIDSPPGYITAGEIRYNGESLIGMDRERRRQINGRKIAMIFQDPLAHLNPVYTAAWQISEILTAHGIARADAKARALELMERVGIPDAKERMNHYPHQFSGGQRQRLMIGMALGLKPDILIADEPTTALDVTVQAQILDLIRDLQKEFGSAVVIITHDLGVVAELADDILVMYAGRAVEYGPASEVFSSPQHPYTWGLLGSVPRWDRARTERLAPIPGSPPSLINVPAGCPFHPRCPYAELTGGQASTSRPELRRAGSGDHLVACHLSEERRAHILDDEIRPKL